MKKGIRTLSVLGLTAISIGAVSLLASCDDRERFYIWCPGEIKDQVKEQVEAWIEKEGDANESNKFTDQYRVRYTSVGMQHLATDLATDTSKAGSVFFFPQDQLATLIKTNLIQPVSETFKDDVISRNDEDSVAAASLGDTLYAYPVTSDNAFFTFYNATKMNEWINSSKNTNGWKLEEILKDQTKLITVAKDLEMTIAMGLTDGWYPPSYFMAAGAFSTWELNADQSFYKDGVTDNYNSDQGIVACRAMYELIHSGVWIDSNDGPTQLSRDALISVTGSWDYVASEKALSSKKDGPYEIGCSTLWDCTVDVSDLSSYNGEKTTTITLQTWSGNKLIGTKQEEDATKSAFAQSIANWLSDYDRQLERFNEHVWGPSNLKAQESEDFRSNPAMVALNEQLATASYPQGNYPDSWWDWTKEIGAAIWNNDDMNTAVKTALDGYTSKLNEYLNNDSNFK